MGDAVLLLGGGFIGGALAKRLAVADRIVHLVRRRPASADFSNVHVHVGNLEDRDLLARLLPLCGTVVYLASETTPSVSARSPSLELANLLPMLTVLEVMQDFPAVHLVYFSSGGTLYGNPDSLPVAEDAPLAPVSFHGAGKAAQEMFLQALRAQGWAVTVLRPANAYGPDQPLCAGFGLVRTILENIRHERPIEIWGDGEAVRDFIYVDDVAAACALLVASPHDSGTYNVGSGTGCSINELLKHAGKVCGKMPQVVYRPVRDGDVSRVVLDITRVRTLGWQPAIGLDEGMGRTWEWLKRQP